MSTEKAAMRKAIRARYPGKSQRDAESARLCAVIAQSDLFRRANVVAGYVPMAREADIMPLLRLTLDLGKMLLLPRVEGGRQMTMRQICDLSALIPGTYGIPEPPESAPILSPDAIDLLLTPLEGIAPDGTRLGKGGGYYDGLLPLKMASRWAAPCRGNGWMTSRAKAGIFRWAPVWTGMRFGTSAAGKIRQNHES